MSRKSGSYDTTRTLPPPKAACGECGATGVLVNDGPFSICGDCDGSGIEKAAAA